MGGQPLTKDKCVTPVIAITGASGFIGRHLVAELLGRRDDVQIRALIHRSVGSHTFKNKKLVTFNGNLMRPETLEGLFEAGCTVVNLAYLASRSNNDNLLAMSNLVDACVKAKIKRMVHCSTAVVAGRAPNGETNEETPCAPANAYELTKLGVEKLLLEKASGRFELVILRPTAVFGPGGKNLLKLAGNLARGNRTINYLKSCLYGYRKMNLVCIDNVISAITFLIETDKSIDRETFIVSDDDDPANNYRDVEKYLMNALDIKAYPLLWFQLPRFLLAASLKLAGKPNINPARVYLAHKLVAAGYKKRVPFEAGLKSFADWYREEFRPAGTGDL